MQGSLNHFEFNSCSNFFNLKILSSVEGWVENKFVNPFLDNEGIIIICAVSGWFSSFLNKPFFVFFSILCNADARAAGFSEIIPQTLSASNSRERDTAI